VAVKLIRIHHRIWYQGGLRLAATDSLAENIWRWSYVFAVFCSSCWISRYGRDTTPSYLMPLHYRIRFHCFVHHCALQFNYFSRNFGVENKHCSSLLIFLLLSSFRSSSFNSQVFLSATSPLGRCDVFALRVLLGHWGAEPLSEVWKQYTPARLCTELRYCGGKVAYLRGQVGLNVD
jgi:hypothetical protein